jgi:hypothetical protein
MRSRAHIAGHLTAPLLVVLWVLQCLLALQHAGAHAHRYCATHSAFEEAPVSREQARAPHLGDGAAVEKRTATASESSDHEVCAFLQLGERQAVVGAGASPCVHASTTPLHVPAVPALARAWSPLSVLDTAPKASPPARA